MAYIGITSTTDSEQLSPNYIGFQPTFQRPESAFVVDTFTADGSQAVFPLSNPKPTTSRALLVSVAGYSMVPIIDYDLDQYGNLEFVTAPGSGASITVHHLIFPKNEATTAIRKLDDISSGFNGVNTRFTLTANSVAANILGANVLVISVNGVIQEPGEAYIMDDDDIIFSEAPPVHSSFYGIDVGTTGIGTPGDATITSNKFITDNTASTGKVLGVNSSGELSWVTVTGGIGATDLDGLSDVSLALPMSGQVLRFNGSNFVNARLNYSDLQGPPSLAAVATSGSYNDLTNKPAFPTDLNGFTDSTGLLFDGDYASLTNLPNIPDHLTDLMDIDVANLTYNQVLVYDGNAWINDSLQLTDLSIVDGTAGQVLTTNGSGEFTFTTITGGSGGAPYTLPTATTSALGGVKVDGTSITISNGIISASGVTSYNDLTDKPTIPGDISDLTDTTNLLFSGSYNDLSNTPSIPADVSDLTDTTNLFFSGNYTDLTNKPTIPAAQVNSDWNSSSGLSQILNKPTLFSGAYADLTGKPTLFSGSYNDLTSKPALFSGSYTDLTSKPTLVTSYTQLTDKPTLFSGSYTDLTDKPTLLKGDTGATGATGPAGADGATGPQGPSGEGLINQTIILNNIAPSIIYTNTAVTEWSASYTGTGGQLLVKADITAYTSSSATKNWYLKKNGTTVATGSFFFNNANVHLTMPTLQYVDTTGSTSSTTWSITVGSGLVVDMGDRATITVTEYTGITSINVSSLTASGDVSGQGLISTFSTGDEGGEIQLAKPQTNTTIGGTSVIIDIFQNRLRIFESGGNNRGGYFDLTTLGNSVSTNLANLTYLLEAYASVTYTLPGSFTEDVCRYSVVNNTVNVSSSWFNTSTYTFTPLKAGYWQITAAYDVYRNTEASMAIKKNGSIVATTGSFGAVAQQITKIVFLNGSTDYINIINVGGAALSRSQYDGRSWFQARWVGE